MTIRQLAEHIGNMDDRLVRQAEQSFRETAISRRKRIRSLGAVAAVLVLMISSFSIGALAFARETIVEVPAEQECVTLEDIGLTVILPESWKGNYEVIQDVFLPNGSTMWEFCVKPVYDAKMPADTSGEIFYRGTLFTIFRYREDSMSADEFATDELAGIGQYLFATEQATYVVLYAGDVQYDPSAEQLAETYQTMLAEIGEIRFVVDNLLAD